MSDTSNMMKYITIVKKDGTVIQQVLDRGEHLCESIYVRARQMGTILSDEDLPEGDCPPVHDTSMVNVGE
jgi:hypothetical protein